MSLQDRIEAANRVALRGIERVGRDLVDEAVAAEAESLRADEALRAAVSIGEEEARGGDAARILATAYRDRDDAPVLNLYQFLDDVYRKTAWRTGAFAYRGQEDLERLERELAEAKRRELGTLSESTVTSLEAILESEREAVDARSERDVEKRSFVRVRSILQQQESAKRDIRALGRQHGADLDKVYSAIENMRLRIHAHERHRGETFRKGQAEMTDRMTGFLAALQEPLVGMTRLGAEPLPDAADVDALPLTDWTNLMETIYLILAADETIVPQEAENRREAWPMPRVVVVPTIGYVLAAPNLAVARYRENVILFPLRCLEEPVGGLARELLKLRRKMTPRLLAVYRDEYHAHIRTNEDLETAFDAMYAKFLRFCLGDEAATRGLAPPERRALREHFLPAFTRDLFVPPSLRPLLRRCVAGTPDGRILFNRSVDDRKEEHFAAGVLYADRAEKYVALLADLRRGRADADLATKYRASIDAARKAALRFFNRAFREGDHGRFALYNTGLVLRSQALETPHGPDREALREKAAYLFEKSLAEAPLDLWSFKAAAFVRECRAGETPPAAAPESEAEGDAAARPAAGTETGAFDLDDEDAGLFEWLRGKITGRR